MQALAGSDPIERRRAADAVTQIAIAHGGDAAGPAVPALQAILAERSADLRQLSAAALEQIGPPAAASVPALLRVFQHDDAAMVRRCGPRVRAHRAFGERRHRRGGRCDPERRGSRCQDVGRCGADCKRACGPPCRFLRFRPRWTIVMLQCGYAPRPR